MSQSIAPPRQPLTSQARNGLRRLRLCLRVIAGLSPSPSPRQKVALLISIDYKDLGKQHALIGPQKDIEAMEELLRDVFKFDKVITLTDKEGTPEHMMPTQANIFRELQSLIPSHPGTDFLFAYSGHSFQRPDFVGQESDRREEYIVPYDAIDPSLKDELNSASAIIQQRVINDKALNRFLVQCLPRGAQLVAIIDSCHSGTLLNLQHQRCNQTVGCRGFLRKCVRKALEPIFCRMCARNVETPSDLENSEDKSWYRKWTQCCTGFCSRGLYDRQVTCISACDDSQEIIDSRSGSPTIIQSIVKLLKENREPVTYEEVMKAVREGAEKAKKNLDREIHEYLARKHCPLPCISTLHMCLSEYDKAIKERVRAKSVPQLSSLWPIDIEHEIFKF